jgi:hypothetical protein
MGVIRTVFGSLEPEYRAELAHAVLPRRIPSRATLVTEAGGRRAFAGRRRIQSRSLEELIHMCRLVMADDSLDQREAHFLLDWIENNLQSKDAWPASLLFERLSRAMSNRMLDANEETELLEILHKVTGRFLNDENAVSGDRIPFDDPAPKIVYQGRQFALTGQFLYGSRKRVAALIESRGGTCASSLPRDGGYLLIGTFGAEEWRADEFGSKIAEAVELRDAGRPVSLVDERHWVEELSEQTPTLY